MEGISEDIGSYLDWTLELGLWDGRPISRFEASEFQSEVSRRLVEMLQEADDSTFEQLALQFAWVGTAQADRVLLAREIQHFDFSKGDLILQAGLKKSLSTFWKKHKKEILIGAAIVAVITVVVVVSVSTAGTGTGAVATAGGAALAACEGDKPEKQPSKKEIPPSQPVPETLQLSKEPFPSNHQMLFEETGVLFDGRLTSYTDILLNRVEPSSLISSPLQEMYPTPTTSWPKVEPPSFLDVQPHVLTPWKDFDFLQAPPSLREEFFERIAPPSLEAPAPSPKATSWLSIILETLGKKIAEFPNLFDPESFSPFSPEKAAISYIFSTHGKRVPWLGFGGANGMNTTEEEAISHANYFAQFSEGYSLDWVYNRTHGPIIDILEILMLNLRGFSPYTAAYHRQIWETFHKSNLDRPFSKYLQFGHSQDSIHIFNALRTAPREIQQRVFVILFGPAVVIPDDLCFRARHYACEGDIVSAGEILDANVFGGLLASLPLVKQHKDKIIWVPPHPNTKSPHELKNPAFLPIIKFYFSDYISRDGIYCNSNEIEEPITKFKEIK